MEELVRGFIRVQRGLTPGPWEVVDAIQVLYSGGNATYLAPEIQLGVLDLPPANQQQENIAAVTSSSKAELLRKAVNAPDALTDGEIKILKARYWSDVSLAEEAIRDNGESALLAVSEDHGAKPLMAIAEAAMEEWRRRMAGWKQERATARDEEHSKAQGWVRRLWDEERGERSWGYAAYMDPAATPTPEDREEYFGRQDALLFGGKLAIGCGPLLSAQWTMQYLPWPTMAVAEGPGSEEDVKQSHGDESSPGKLELLRQDFREARDRPPGSGKYSYQNMLQPGLVDGIQRNVFLVIDKASASTLIPTRASRADYVWIWAVDPDFQSSADDSSGRASRGSAQPVYAGYLRVRLQQLVNSFFESRRFRAEEISMEDLWRAAQGSYVSTASILRVPGVREEDSTVSRLSEWSDGHSFVSLKKKDWNDNAGNRDVGAAMRLDSTGLSG
ncbi:hypothetical protein LTR78_003768 [Recurvomyces mirabilis]|uniref:Uncharacterized protein n=1 Tax=Recurvomyces mirabilis TaxID=574656 RepID=A0AAE0WRF1_9PEZI|nr:hypothetical protein LTR78_003768 [Recurvomyces mirabilis]KAK5154880.1 hypothetical protein LTS14_006461 [Recurvomyces mirabilis]